MAKTKKLSGRKRDERITAYAFVAPAVILLIAFLVVPMISYRVFFRVQISDHETGCNEIYWFGKLSETVQ